jgi:type III secretion protein R
MNTNLAWASGGGLASNQVHLMGLMALLALVPFAFVMLTSFSKIAVVLSILRSALGTQQAPPAMVLTGLAAVLSTYIMNPTVTAMWAAAQRPPPLDATPGELLDRVAPVIRPLREFLLKNGSAEERARLVELARELRTEDEGATVYEADVSVIIPAFVLTELREAFIIGFIVFLPFLVVDMLVANVLLALGMQSLSPSQVSLPFKILLFVAADGWSLLSRGLALGYR